MTRKQALKQAIKVLSEENEFSEVVSLLKDIYEIYHFEGDVTDNDVKFDYKLKDGPATTRNAIMLLRVLGYDENIVENAQKMADGFSNTGSWL